MNAGFERLTGYSLEEIRGRSCAAIGIPASLNHDDLIGAPDEAMVGDGHRDGCLDVDLRRVHRFAGMCGDLSGSFVERYDIATAGAYGTFVFLSKPAAAAPICRPSVSSR